MELQGWEYFDHQADIGIRGFGKSPEAAFEQCAMAMMAIITKPSLIDARDVIEISCEEADSELLLIDWLNAIIYEMATRKMLFGRFKVTIKNGLLKGRIWGEPIDVERHHPAVEVKGATYTELALYESAHQWIAQCVVDV